MQITEQELEAILQRNPHLHIHDYGAPSKRQRKLYPDSEELTREYAMKMVSYFSQGRKPGMEKLPVCTVLFVNTGDIKN